MIFVSQRVISGHILFFLPVMKKPAAALNLHLRSCSSTELLPLLLFCLFLSLSFPVHLVHSKSDTSNGEEPVQWQILTKNNFSSQVRLNPHILLIVTVPWSGESRSLMKELAHMVSKKKEEFKTLKLMLVYKNHDKMLAEALGATMETNIISYRHSLPYKYQGTFRVQSILSSAHYLMSLLPEELPFKSLQTAQDLTTFLESTDKAFLVLEFCGWTPKLMAKVMNNRSENAFGVPLVAGLHGQSSEPDGIKNKGIGNEKIQCDEFSGLPELGEFAPLNESDFMEAEKTRSTIDEASCSYEEFQLFESSLYNLTTSVRDFFLPPERLKFGLVSERSLISSLGVGDTSSWLMMVYSSGCPECAKVFKEGGDFKRIIEINSSPVMELKGDEYDLDPGLPSDRPTMVLFIDRSSDSLKIRRKSKEALNTFRQLALHNHTPSKTNPQKHLIASQHPKLEMTTSLQKVTALKDKIFLMAMKEGKHITIDDIASSLQGSSLQEVLTQLLQKKKEKKLSSLAKDVGFQLLSDDIDITVPDTDGTDVSSSVPSDDVDLTVTGTVPVTGVNCSFFFIDGQFRLLKHLSTVQKIPSLVIINPLSHQHYVYPQDSNFNFTYSDISNFLHMFLNGSLVPYQRSGSIVTNPKESPRPPFVNQDFHEVDSIPRVNALSFMELVVGNNNHSGLNNISWKKDVLVLFTSSWCGFCLRTELVVREVYQAFKNYGNLVKSQLKKVNLKLPVIYMIDCTENDCTSLLKSSTKRDLYPSLVLYPSESKEAISYDGETSVHNIIKFIADQGGDSHWIYKEQGILWTEPQQEQWNEKPLKEPILDSDVSFSHEILLKDRSDSGPHNSEPDNNNNIVSQTSVNEIKIQPGSILIATQKLQSIYPFAKSKILIVKVNTTTGFQGLIVNKHISWDTITRLEEGLDSLKEAPLSYGGPVIARELPLVSLTREIQPSGNNNNEYFEVLPDVYFLDQWATISLIQNLKLHNRSMTDYWFFVGYSSWGWAQLFDEIADGSWNVVDGTDHKFDWPMS